jgi:hypothetical protein
MQCSCDKNGADLKGIKGNNHPFSIEEENGLPRQ